MNIRRALVGVDRVDLVFRSDLMLVYLASFVAVSGVTLIAPILPSMIGPLGGSEASIGLLISFYTLPSVVLTPVVGSLADRIGRTPILFFGLLLFAVAGSLVAVAPSLTIALSLRLLQGVGFACVMPLTIVLIGDYLSTREEVAAQGLRGSANALGEFVFPALGGLLVLLDWYFPFLVYLLVIPLALAVWRGLDEPLAAGVERQDGYVRELRRWALHYPNLMVLLVGLTRFLLKFGVYIYLPVYLVTVLGFPVWSGGTLVAVSGALNAVVSSQAGRTAARFSKTALMTVGFGLLGFGMLLLGLTADLPWLTAGAVLIGIGDGMVGPVQRSLLTQNSATALRGGVIGANHLFVSIGKTVAAPLLGLILLVGSLQLVFFVMTAVAVASAVLVLSLTGRFENP